MTTKIVRGEVEDLPDGNELHLEIHEDDTQGGLGHKVMLTLQGKASGIAIGRANLGQVLRRLTRTRAEDIVDAVLAILRKPEDVAIDAALRTKLEESMRPDLQGVPAPVKGRPENQAAVAGVELDPFGRKDLAGKLRQLADEIEVRDPKLTIQQLDIEPIRGGGQAIALRVIRR